MSQEFVLNVFCVNGSTATYFRYPPMYGEFHSLSIFVVSQRKQLLLDCTSLMFGKQSRRESPLYLADDWCYMW